MEFFPQGFKLAAGLWLPIMPLADIHRRARQEKLLGSYLLPARFLGVGKKSPIRRC
jgi:hypothetical protein